MIETEPSASRGEPAVAAMLERGLAPDALRAVRLAAELGAARGQAVHLVGGPVRDLLLGRAVADIDLMVEGDCAPLAVELAAALGGDLRRHPEFLTATVAAAGGLGVDLASARAESYPAPGALPRVRPGSIAEDLARRDFTVNALALRLGPQPGPALIDLGHGREDLDRRRLRVLHERSFEDDPTRIVRGVRFEARLAFRFDRATEELARDAVANGGIGRLSGSRLGRELRLVAGEEGAPACLARLADLGVMRAIDPDLDLPASARELLAAVGEGLAWSWRQPAILPPADAWRVYLLALLWGHPELPAERLAVRLDLTGRARDRLLAGRRVLADAGVRVSRPGLAPHQVAAALADLDVEELVVLRAVGPPAAAERVEAELTRHRSLELRIRGADLLALGHPPGPAIGRVLAATRVARLDGRIDAAGELDFALAELAADRVAPGGAAEPRAKEGRKR